VRPLSMTIIGCRPRTQRLQFVVGPPPRLLATNRSRETHRDVRCSIRINPVAKRDRSGGPRSAMPARPAHRERFASNFRPVSGGLAWCRRCDESQSVGYDAAGPLPNAAREFLLPQRVHHVLKMLTRAVAKRSAYVQLGQLTCLAEMGDGTCKPKALALQNDKTFMLAMAVSRVQFGGVPDTERYRHVTRKKNYEFDNRIGTMATTGATGFSRFFARESKGCFESPSLISESPCRKRCRWIAACAEAQMHNARHVYRVLEVMRMPLRRN